MKICYATIDVIIPYHRGASTHVYEVARYLSRLGHEVHVVSRRKDRFQQNYEKIADFYVHRIFRGIIAPLFSAYNGRKNVQKHIPNLLNKIYEFYLFSLYAFLAGIIVSKIVKKFSIDIILERETSFGAGGIASIISRRPLVLEIIGPRYSRVSLKRAKKTLVYTKKMVRDTIPESRLALVTAAADVEIFYPNYIKGAKIREKYNLQNSMVVGYVGTFAGWHGIEELIDASIDVIKRFPDVKFLMVGPYFEKARKLAAEKGVANSFIFTGPIPYANVPDYINAADILVAPYNPAKSELRRKYGIGSPLKVFEYMACGKPVITTAIEPITQVIREGKTGVLITPGDSEALSEAIIHLVEKPTFAERLGKAAKEEVKERYSWRAFALQLENILKEAIKGM